MIPCACSAHGNVAGGFWGKIVTISKHIGNLDKVTPLSFKGFELDVRRRKLTYRGTPVAIGSRAFDILCALAQRPGNIVSKGEIISFVWPDTHVDEGALRVHLNALRKALRAHCCEELVVNIAGRGYSLASEVSHARTTKSDLGSTNRLPWLPFNLIGRAELLHRWTSEEQARGNTIVGAAGIGKSSMAISLARAISDDFDAVFYVDLSRASTSVIPEIVSSMGLPDDVLDVSEICRVLSSCKVLLVLDGCDSDRDNIAVVIDKLLFWTPGLHVIATALEPLGFRGERIKVLRGLATPSSAAREEIVASPAVSLFISAAGEFDDLAFQSDKVLQLVAEIVRSLGGIPAAIESVARELRSSTIELIHKTVVKHASHVEQAGIFSLGSDLAVTTEAPFESNLWSASFDRRTIRPSPGVKSTPTHELVEGLHVRRSGYRFLQTVIASEVSHNVVALRSGRPPPPSSLGERRRQNHLEESPINPI